MESYPNRHFTSPAVSNMNSVRGYVNGDLILETAFADAAFTLPLIGAHTGVFLQAQGPSRSFVTDWAVTPYIDRIDNFSAGRLTGDGPVTEITESFNTADSRTIGPDLTWVKDGYFAVGSLTPYLDYEWAPDDGVIQNNALTVDGGVTHSSWWGQVRLRNTAVISSALMWAECQVTPGIFAGAGTPPLTGNYNLGFAVGVRVPDQTFVNSIGDPVYGGLWFLIRRFYNTIGAEGPDFDGTWFTPTLYAYFGNDNAPPGGGGQDVFADTNLTAPFHLPAGQTHTLRIEVGTFQSGGSSPIRDTGTTSSPNTRVVLSDQKQSLRVVSQNAETIE